MLLADYLPGSCGICHIRHLTIVARIPRATSIGMFILKVAFAAVCARGILADQPACSIPSLYSASLEELTLGLENGCFTSVDLVQAYEARINEVNDELHAVVELNPDALSIAAELDAERANGSTRSLLHGIPILVKDNIATFDKMNNTAGSYALLGAKVPRDSSVVHKLKTGGAIILGKTNLSQWAMFRSGNTTSGWSSIGGQTYGPYYPNQDPCVSALPSSTFPEVFSAMLRLDHLLLAHLTR